MFGLDLPFWILGGLWLGREYVGARARRKQQEADEAEAAHNVKLTTEKDVMLNLANAKWTRKGIREDWDLDEQQILIRCVTNGWVDEPRQARDIYKLTRLGKLQLSVME